MSLYDSSLVSRYAMEIGVSPLVLGRIARTAPLRYKEFYIRKKNGSLRKVAQPAKEVKLLQRFIVRDYSDLLPVHGAASAYIHGRSIKDNAEAHRGNGFLLKMDFQNFFPSIVESDVCKHFRRHMPEVNEDDLSLICHIVLWAPNRIPPRRVCIGAPSSSWISNTMMFEFDEIVSEYSRGLGVTYTRYADDLSFSTNCADVLSEVEVNVRQILSSLEYPILAVNEQKTVHASLASRRIVTGITITSQRKLSIGRERKRKIRAMYHHSLLNKLQPEEEAKLRGLMAFADHIEPGFSARLRESMDDKV